MMKSPLSKVNPPKPLYIYDWYPPKGRIVIITSMQVSCCFAVDLFVLQTVIFFTLTKIKPFFLPQYFTHSMNLWLCPGILIVAHTVQLSVPYTYHASGWNWMQRKKMCAVAWSNRKQDAGAVDFGFRLCII